MTLELLISEVKHLLELEKIKKQEKKARGERFNIFSIMRMKTDEVHTHSALIAAMLNPKGPHGSGNMYLNLFLQSVTELHGIDFDTANAKADYEYSIGDINEDKTEGGRIDILIESGPKAIIIENKVYAEDQPKQLLRYKNFAKSKYSEYYILYLTIDGKKASNESCNGMLEEEYIKVSYRDTIKDWLTECIEKSATKPLVRETLVQYQNLILKLTHQDMDESILQSFSDLCKESGDLRAMLQIHEYYDSIMDNVLSNLLPDQLKKLAGEALILKVSDKKWNEKRMSFSFARPDWKYFEIAFMFEKENFTDMRCGFRYAQYSENKQYPQNTTYDELAKIKTAHTTSRWPYYYKCEGYANWKNGNVIESIYNGDLIKKIEKDLERLLTISDKLSKKGYSF